MVAICEDGLFFRGVSIQTPTLYFEIVSGFWEPAEVSGRDVLIPGRPGMYEAEREKRRRIVQLEGWTLGASGDYPARQATFADANAILAGLLDFTIGSDELIIVPPYLGQTTEQTLVCKPINVVTTAPVNRATRQQWSIQLESVENPPEWVAGS